MTKKSEKAETARSPRATRKKADDVEQFPGSLFAQNARAVDVLRASTSIMQNWVATSRELTSFCSKRLRKDLDTMGAYADCRSPQDLIEVMGQAASDYVHDYADEFERVIEMNKLKYPNRLEPDA